MPRSQRLLRALSFAFLLIALTTRFAMAHYHGEKSADAAIGAGIVHGGEQVAVLLSMGRG